MTFILEFISQEPGALLIWGIVGLLIGSYCVSQGASMLMHRFGIAPMLVAVFLSLAATLPEFTVTAQSLGPQRYFGLDDSQIFRYALMGTQLPLGLILGSTLINIMVLTSVGALCLSVFQGRKMYAGKRLLGRDLLALIATIGVILWFLSRAVGIGDGGDFTESTDAKTEFLQIFGGFLLAGGALYLIVAILIEFIIGVVDDNGNMFQSSAASRRNPILVAVLFILGITFLYISSYILVAGVHDFVAFVFNSSLPNGNGLSSDVCSDGELCGNYAKFGLFIIAAGVAAPELMMMFANVLRRDAASISLTICTLIGASIFNLLFVLGFALTGIASGPIVPSFELAPFFGDFVFVGLGILTLSVFLVNDLWQREEHGILSGREALTLIALYVLYVFYRLDYFSNGFAAVCNSNGIFGSICRWIGGLFGIGF